MQVELNIPLPDTLPATVIKAAQTLRKHGFAAPAARIAIHMATRSRS